MKEIFSPSNVVFRGTTVEETVSAFLHEKDKADETVAEQLRSLLVNSRDETGYFRDHDGEVECHFDQESDEYLIVRRGAYSAVQLLETLLYLLVRFPHDEVEVEIEQRSDAIGRFLGVIEEKEGIELSREIESMREVSGEMVRVISMIREDEYTDEELETLSSSLDREYYESLLLISQGILIEIGKGAHSSG